MYPCITRIHYLLHPSDVIYIVCNCGVAGLNLILFSFSSFVLSLLARVVLSIQAGFNGSNAFHEEPFGARKYNSVQASRQKD